VHGLQAAVLLHSSGFPHVLALVMEFLPYFTSIPR
jgi:hypothetical protein